DTEAKSDDDSFSLDDYTIIEDESMLHAKVKIARDYITSILKAIDIDVTYTIYQNETGAVINIESNNNGTVIGRRGETLDSIQYLCSIIANKGDKDYFRITIDCLGYRSKRRETLQQLAAKVSKSVIRTGRSQQLEPMNPYERRIIHSTVSGIEGVSSRSVGEEPYRKIIISSTNPKNNSRGRGKGGRHDDRRGNNRNRSERRSREPFESKAIDVSTSFEKEYKKPKPEDSMEGGLYGKIEF
ncbi:MAG: protein jag, partial [Ruminococcus sp.]|nr:protein jag [Ruminococcus sp.]